MGISGKGRKYIIMSEENKMENNSESTGAASAAEKQNSAAETGANEAEVNETAANEAEVNETAANETGANETAAEEAAEKDENTEEISAEQAPQQTEESNPESAPAKKNKKTVIGVSVAAVVVIVAAVLLIMFKNTLFNPYIKDYIDVNGITIGETADRQGMEYSDFLEFYDLPKDMPKSTPQQAAVYNIPAGRYAEAIVGWDFESMKQQLGWGDDITEETTIGDALDQTTIGNYVGEDRFEEFKSTFGLDDSVTVDTLWGEVRNIVDTKQKEEYEAEMAGITEEPAEETEAATESDTSATEKAVSTEAADAATQAAE